MNGRQRILNLLSGRTPLHDPTQGLAWNALVDTYTLSAMPAEVQAQTVVDFCRRIGCDVIQLGDFSLPPELWAGDSFEAILPEVSVQETVEPGDLTVRHTQTPWGELIATFRRSHPLKYPVTNLAELDILKNIWLATRYVPAGPAWEEAYRRLDAHIGEDGIYTHFLWPSPVQRLIQYDLGMENFYYLLHDQPEKLEDLMAIMQRRWLESLEIACAHTPADVIISAENTSTTLLSPSLYQRYSLPHLQQFVEVVHRHQKKAVLHMCGWIRQLLPLICQTGLDGIHALTPPTIGDTPFDAAMDAFRPSGALPCAVILMGILDGRVFHAETVTAREIREFLDRLYTPRLRQANFILIVAADGLPTPLWKFEAVQEWMAKNGGRS